MNFLSSFICAKGEYFMSKRTARDFSRSQIKHIAEQYAITPLHYSAEYFSIEYKISKTTFYTLLEKAVVESIVDLKTVDYMQRKASGNSAGHAGVPAAARSLKHYNHLIMKRNIYLPSRQEATRITIDFAKSNLSMSQYAKKLCISSDSDLLKRIIRSSVANNYVAGYVEELLRQKKAI